MTDTTNELIHALAEVQTGQPDGTPAHEARANLLRGLSESQLDRLANKIQNQKAGVAIRQEAPFDRDKAIDQLARARSGHLPGTGKHNKMAKRYAALSDEKLRSYFEQPQQVVVPAHVNMLETVPTDLPDGYVPRTHGRQCSKRAKPIFERARAEAMERQHQMIASLPPAEPARSTEELVNERMARRNAGTPQLSAPRTRKERQARARQIISGR